MTNTRFPYSVLGTDKVWRAKGRGPVGNPTPQKSQGLISGVRGVATYTVGPPDPPPGGPPAAYPVTDNSNAGAVPLGTASYPIPSGALFVDSTGGSDSNPGTISQPFATIAHAFSAVASGGTIVLRANTFHEGLRGGVSVYGGIALTKTNVTVQNYPNEVVWIDGSSVVTGWTASGSNWTVSKTLDFDRSPTQSFGAADGTGSFGYINPSYPCASWPERVFINGVEQQQVSTLAAVGPGKFYVTASLSGFVATSSAYTIGTDPTGKEVRISDMSTTISPLASGCTFRGFGIRRFAPSVAHQGCMKTNSANVTFENLVFNNISTGALYAISKTGIVIRNVTIDTAGWLGLGANNTNGISILNCRTVNGNAQRFNSSPAAGNIKITRLRGATVQNCYIAGSLGNGFWTDETVYGLTMTGCDVVNNSVHGLVLELSDNCLIADCLVANNGGIGLFIRNTGTPRVENCTLTGNGTANVDFAQDSRLPVSASTTGWDTRYSWPDPLITWKITSCEMKNTVSVKPGSAGLALRVRSQESPTRGWQAFNPVFDYNFYGRISASSPANEFSLQAAGAGGITYASLNSYRTATGLDAHAVSIDGVDPLTSGDALTTAAASAGAATTIAADVAAAMGKPTTAHLGSYR